MIKEELEEVKKEIEETIEEVKKMPFWTNTKKAIALLSSTILATLFDNQDAILEYLKSLDFKYYILAVVLISVLGIYGLKKGKKDEQPK